MTEKEFKELKVGDEVSAFVFDKKCTAIVESIARDTGRCTARFKIPLRLESHNYYGTMFYFEPATKVAIVEAYYSKLEIVKAAKE